MLLTCNRNTFSEFRDRVMQQARQRAEGHVGDVCHLTKKVSYATSERKHEQSSCHKSYSSGPNGCVLDKFERIETRNKRTGESRI